MWKERRSDNMNTYIYEAKTFEEAINKALAELNITEDNLIIKSKEEKQGLLKKSVKLEVINVNELVSSYGLAIILACLLIRLALMPITKKTAVQSELIKKAQPELDKLEKKYKGKDSQEAQTQKAQEMLMIYQFVAREDHHG